MNELNLNFLKNLFIFYYNKKGDKLINGIYVIRNFLLERNNFTVNILLMILLNKFEMPLSRDKNKFIHKLSVSRIPYKSLKESTCSIF